jgi:hypothetical protein
MAQRRLMKASKASAAFCIVSIVSTERLLTNPSAAFNVLNAAQKWTTLDPYGWETSSTLTFVN